MAKGLVLSPEERRIITQKLAKGLQPCQIAKLLKRDTRTIKKAINNIDYQRKSRRYYGKLKVTERELRKIKKVVRKHPLATSKFIFDKAGVPNCGKTLRCETLQKLADNKKAEKRQQILPRHEIQRLDWGRKYMKLHFPNVIFTDEMRATLDGPDGWRRGWVLKGHAPPTLLRRQQGGGGIMIWAGIVGNRMVGPFKIEEGVKINSENYTTFLDVNFFPWYRSQTRSFKLKCMFMHDNAPSHASQYTKAYLESKGVKGDKIMQWPANSPDLNPIENLWSIVKRRLYPDSKQYMNKRDLWEALKKVCSEITAEEIENLTNTMDDRLFRLVQRNGRHVRM